MDEADGAFNSAGLPVFVFAVVAFLIRCIGERAVGVGALAQIVLIACRERPSGEVALVLVVFTQNLVGLVVGINVARADLGRAAEERNISADREAPAFGKCITAAEIAERVNDADRRHVGVVEVLNADVGLHNAEIVRAAEGDDERVVNVFAVELRRIVRRIHDENHVHIAVLVRGADAVVAVDGGLAFRAVRTGVAVVFGLAVAVKRILGVDVEARKGRRLVGDRVVKAGAARHEVGRIARIVAPGRAERGNRTREAVGAVVTERFP